jgi:hypothetical protein
MDLAADMVVADGGIVYLAGTEVNDSHHSWVIRLDTSTGARVRATFGDDSTSATALALGSRGLYLAGESCDPVLPMPNGYQQESAGYCSPFVYLLDAGDLSLINGTWLNGRTGRSFPSDLQVMRSGILVTGWTESHDFPTTRAKSTPDIYRYGFVATLSQDLAQLMGARPVLPVGEYPRSEVVEVAVGADESLLLLASEGKLGTYDSTAYLRKFDPETLNEVSRTEIPTIRTEQKYYNGIAVLSDGTVCTASRFTPVNGLMGSSLYCFDLALHLKNAVHGLQPTYALVSTGGTVVGAGVHISEYSPHGQLMLTTFLSEGWQQGSVMFPDNGQIGDSIPHTVVAADTGVLVLGETTSRSFPTTDGTTYAGDIDTFFVEVSFVADQPGDLISLVNLPMTMR